MRCEHFAASFEERCRRSKGLDGLNTGLVRRSNCLRGTKAGLRDVAGHFEDSPVAFPWHPALTVRASELGTHDQIAEGGEATVHRLSEYPDFLYKQFKAPRPWEGDLQQLVLLPAHMHSDHRKLLLSRTAWPVAGVLDDVGGCIGSIMPCAPPEFWFSPHRTAVLRPIAELCFPAKLSQRSIRRPSIGEVLTVLCHGAELLSVLHGYAAVVGDISHANWAFSVDPEPGLFAVDCDSYFVTGAAHDRYRQTPDWHGPQGNTATIASDLAKFYLLVHRVLSGAYNSNPEDGRPTIKSPYGRIPTSVTALTRRASANPEQLPSARDWALALGSTRDDLPVATEASETALLMAAMKGDWAEASRLLPHAARATPVGQIILRHIQAEKHLVPS